MLDISLSGIIKNFGFDKKILDNFNLEIHNSERVALIGPNGCGKTTIFKIIMGEENIQDGVVSIRKNANLGMLTQIPSNVDDDILVKDIITKNLSDIYELENKIKDLELKMANINDQKELEKILKTYGRLQEDFEKQGGYELDAKINKICNGFKIKNEILERNYNSLSGGEKTIVNLAALMIKSPSILLLDEPTNHLDIETLEWFEEYLKDYKGTILISSHDRYFLDQVVTKTVLIERGQAEIFHGNYSYYLKENENRIMNEFADFKNQQKQIEAMKRKIKQLQEWGKLAFPGGEPFFKRAASIQKRLDKIELLDKPLKKKDLPLDFQIEKRSGKDVLIIKNLDLTLGQKKIFSNLNMHICYQEKVCLMGPNGSGKSSLIRCILGNIESYQGEIKLGSNIHLGYMPQEIKFSDDKLTILDYARSVSSLDETRLRSTLAKFLFYDDSVFKRVGKLSGGEKVRLKLFELIQKKANFLILDEPTNHIDIETKEILEEALLEYEGTILFISHDRYFINKLADKIYNIEYYSLQEYLGNYNFYKEHI